MDIINNLYVYGIKPDENISNELNALLDKIPLWRKKKILSYKHDIDKFLCAKAYIILKDGLNSDYNINDEIKFSYNNYGKPFLINHPEIHFSLSHCRKGVACAISGTPVGIDIEEIMYDDDIANYILNKEDYQNVISSSNPAEYFTKLWTEKESYLKMLGCGIISNMKELITNNAHFSTSIDRDAGYIVTLCSRIK